MDGRSKIIISLRICIFYYCFCARAGTTHADDLHPLKVFRTWDNYSMDVTELPQAGSYTYKNVAKESFVALPSACVQNYKLLPNMNDKGSPDTLHIWLGRLGDLAELEGGLDVQECSCGLVLFLLGSGGATAKNNRYLRMLAALGYVVLAPDTMAHLPNQNLRHREGQRPIDAGTLSDYWSDSPLYTDSCSWPTAETESSAAQYPFCYSTMYQNVVGDPGNWKRYYQRVFQLRSAEMDEVLVELQRLLGDTWPLKTFLLGQSEGGMVASRYFNPWLESLLTGRIISSWSCEYNYYVDSPASASVCGGMCNLRTPLLNIIGTEDEFFGVHDSVAVNVSSSPTGYGSTNLTGNCFHAFQEGGFLKASVLAVEGAMHDMSLTDDNLLRNILASFVADPETFHEATDGWADSCTPVKGQRGHGAFLWDCIDRTDPLKYVFDGPNLAAECAAGLSALDSSARILHATALGGVSVVFLALGFLAVFFAIRRQQDRKSFRFTQLAETSGFADVILDLEDSAIGMVAAA